MKEFGRVSSLLLVLALVRPTGAGIERTVHNLTATGPGPFRGGPQANLCTFCHTPHNANPTRALWNREMPAQTYTLYESTTAQAAFQQPTGSSRLCLSCHDGTIALGATRVHPEPTLGPLTGPAVLGTDLSDDHPVSFVYDKLLASVRPGLADPLTLPREVKLDEAGQVQCTSCHDAHSDEQPKFLVRDPVFSGLCAACHRPPLWEESSHATSAATSQLGPARPLPGLGFATVGENGCSSCHQSHAAPHPARLLRAAAEEQVCLVCHDGTVAQKDLTGEFLKPSAHRVDAYLDVHDPAEDPTTMAQHVECVDCHNPHQARAESNHGELPGPLVGASGLDIGGAAVPQANFEYEVCLKCHGVSDSPTPIVIRADDISNVRLEIDPTNPSFHPLADVGRNPDIQGLLPPLTPASLIRCTSCHTNDAAVTGTPGAPRGPHGSLYAPILGREYRLEGARMSESFQLYALCYFCHDRTVLLSKATPGFPHRDHLVGAGASCAVCHDAHGSRTSEHLINFMRFDRSGAEIVTPSRSGLLQFESLGARAGRCYLTCHGKNHDPKMYGPSG